MRPVRHFESPYMTTEEIAECFNVHFATIYHMIRDEGLPAFKIASEWRFHREAVERWMAARTNGGKEKDNDS